MVRDLVPAIAGALLVSLVLAGCGERDEGSLFRFEGQSYGTDALQATLADRRGAVNPDEVEKTVRDALWTLQQRLYAASCPLADEESVELERRVHWSQLLDCVNLAVKRSLAPFDIETLGRELFDRDPDRYALPATCAVQMIFIGSTTPDARRLAVELLTEVRRDPRRFPELAAEHSQSVSARSDGFSLEIPVKSLHPQLQDPVSRHAGSLEPFLVVTERGCYVLRVVRYSAAVEPVFMEVAKRVMQDAWKQAEDDLFMEAANSVGSVGEVVAIEQTLRLPLVAADDVVCRIGEIGLTLREILPPGARINEGLSGPQVRFFLDQYRRMHVFASYFGCAKDTGAESIPEERGALRLPDIIRTFVRQNLRGEVEAFLARQPEVFRSQAGFRIDLVGLPFRSNDAYAESVRYQPLVDKIRSVSGPDSLESADDDRLVIGGLELTETQVMAYEPLLLEALLRLEPGVWSEPVLSSAVEGLLLVRLVAQIAAKDCDLAEDEDFDRVLDVFLVDQREMVDAAFRRQVEPLFVVNTEVLERFIEDYSAPPQAGVESTGTPTNLQR